MQILERTLKSAVYQVILQKFTKIRAKTIN